MYYNRKGEKCDAEEWIKECQNKIIKQETLLNGKYVSTVYLGLDHNFSRKGKPLIFETMVFPEKGDYSDEYCERYSTEEEAIKGHQEVAEKFSK